MKSVIVLNRHGDVWTEQTFRGDQQVPSMVLPGFTVSVANLWIDVDRDDSSGEHDEVVSD
jgi:hypothetical protein